MAKRFTGTYKSYDEANTYTIEIHDKLYSGASSELEVENPVVYKYGGKQREIRTRVIPTTASLSISLQSAFDEELVIDLQTSDEGRFFLHVYDGSQIEFIGLIMIDQSNLQNIIYPKMFSISATDGLSLLKDKPYFAAQGQSYINQDISGKFRLGLTEDLEFTGGNVNDIDFWTDETDIGDFVTSAEYSNIGTFDFVCHMSVLVDGFASSSDNSVSVRLWKNNEAIAYIISTVEAGTKKRLTFDINERVTLAENDILFIQFTVLSQGTINVKVEKESYFENVLSSAASIINVYGSLIDHLGNLLKQLPTYDEYAAGPFLSVNIPYTESSQGATDSEAYIGIPYNAFTKNIGSQPVETITALKSLEQIAAIANAQLIYRGGQYHLITNTGIPQKNDYDKSITKTGSSSGLFAELPMQCLFTSSYGFLPPYGKIAATFDRIRTKNIISEAAAFFPNEDVNFLYSKPVEWIEQILYFALALRIRGLHPGSPDTDIMRGPHRHIFTLTLKYGSKKINIFNTIDGGPVDEVNYSSPEENDFILASIYSEPYQEKPFQIYDFDVNFTLPPITYTGDFEISIKYEHTLYLDGETKMFQQLIGLRWDVIKMSLSAFDDSNSKEDDLFFKESIVSEAIKGNNSFAHEFKLIASDLWKEDSDPGAIKVWSGGEWIKGDLWDGKALQERIVEQSAVQQDKPVQMFNGTFCVDNLLFGHAVYDNKEMILLDGRFNTRSRELSGQWYVRASNALYAALELKTYVKGTESDHSDSINSLQVNENTNGSLSGGAGVEYFEEFEGLTVDHVIVTIKDLPDPVELNVGAIRRIIKLFLNGVKMRYVETPTMYNQYSIDLTNDNRLIFSESLEDTDVLELYIKL